MHETIVLATADPAPKARITVQPFAGHHGDPVIGLAATTGTDPGLSVALSPEDARTLGNVLLAAAAQATSSNPA